MSDGKKFWRVWAAYGKRLIKKRGGAANWEQPCFKITASGAQCIDDCFAEGRYLYIMRNGAYLPVEVPRDKYGDAVRRLEYYWDKGCMAELRREDAARLAVKSLYTYEQMRNLASSGKVAQLSVAEADGAVEVRHYCGISFVILYAMAIWQCQYSEDAAALVFDKLLSIDFVNKTAVQKQFENVFTAEQLFQNSLSSAATRRAKPGFLLRTQRAMAVGSVVSVISQTFGNILSRRQKLSGNMTGAKLQEKIPEDLRPVLSIIKNHFANLLTTHLAGSREVADALNDIQPVITYEALTDMKNSAFKFEFADSLIHRYIDNVISQRPVIAVPDESAIYKALTKKLRA